MIAQQLEVKGILDDFIEKVAGVNKPYQALVKTLAYKDFKAKFADGISKQAEWAATNIHAILERTHPMTPLTSVQREVVAGYVKQNQPPIAKFINQDDVAAYFKVAFEWGAKAQYQRWFTQKAITPVYGNFSLSNKKYLANLQNRANYLLNQSTLDQTTTDSVINIIADAKASSLTNDEVAQMLKDQFDQISQDRADMIARTETANAMGDANTAVYTENDINMVDWVTAGDNPCIICQDNEDASPIDITQDTFPSGDTHEPAHPNCECYTQADTSSIDLSSISIWDGGDSTDDGSDNG